MASILHLAKTLRQFQPKLASRRIDTDKFAQRFYTLWAIKRQSSSFYIADVRVE